MKHLLIFSMIALGGCAADYSTPALYNPPGYAEYSDPVQIQPSGYAGRHSESGTPNAGTQQPAPTVTPQNKEPQSQPADDMQTPR